MLLQASSVNNNNSPPSSQANLSCSSPSKASNLLPDVFQRVENSVVQITTTESNPNDVIIVNGIPETGKSKALGSGFVYDNQGHIITNFHVIDGANNADVTFTDGNTYSAKVIGKDHLFRSYVYYKLPITSPKKKSYHLLWQILLIYRQQSK